MFVDIEGGIYDQVGKLYVVQHNCVTWVVFNDYMMNSYIFRPVLAIFRLS